MGRRIDKASIEAVSSFAADQCRQANAVGKLWPQGFDVDADPAAALIAFKEARALGLDLVFVAVAICHPEELLEFRDLCLTQLRTYIDGEPAQIMAVTAQNTLEHKAALWYQEGHVAVTGETVYRLSVATLKIARALDGKQQERTLRDEQLDHFERKMARIAAGEKAPILGDTS